MTLYPEIADLQQQPHEQNISEEQCRKESYEKMPQMPKSNLEKNCNQIFAKGPALTRDILEKVQNADIGPDTTYVMGYEVNTRQFWVLAGLLLLFLFSTTGMALMWFTNIFDNMVFSQLEINPENSAFEMWQRPSPKPLFKLYIYNYTNVKEFEDRKADKLNVKEMGPYVYEISLERVNLKFNGSEVEYQEQRQYKFMPELSKGRKQNDRLIVPNIPFFSAVAVNRHASFLTRMGLSGLLNTLDAKPFITLPAHRFAVGYEDSLYDLSKSYLKLNNQKPLDRFGLISGKVGIQDDLITVNTGKKDINKVGKIEKFNGQSKLDYWSTDECNSFKSATDGSNFSPNKIRNKKPVHIYMKELCRPLPAVFEKQVTILDKVPAYRYTLPMDVFDHPDKKPENQCYCDMDSGDCPPQGVFNATACSFGAPLFISFPHFYNADKKLFEGVTGLNPKPKHVESYFDLHPTLGFVMAGKSRLQLNVQVRKSYGITQVNRFEDGLMLPVAWFELSLEDKTLPDDMVGIIFQTTFTVKSVELALKYGCLLTAIVTFISILLFLKNRWQRRERTDSMRRLQGRQTSFDS